MSSALYPKFKELLLQGGIDLTASDIKVVLVDLADYTYSAAHQYLSDIPVAARVATSGNLASKTVTNGVFDAADVTITSVSGDQLEALALYKDTGNASTSPLICFLDAGTGLPLTPDGNNVIITWNASGIFSL